MILNWCNPIQKYLNHLKISKEQYPHSQSLVTLEQRRLFQILDPGGINNTNNTAQLDNAVLALKYGEVPFLNLTNQVIDFAGVKQNSI